DRRLGDLERDASRIDAGPGEASRHTLGEVLVDELARGQVDREPEPSTAAQLVPAHELFARVGKDDVTDLVDETAVLREPDEVIRWDQAMLRVLPAHERLCTAHPLTTTADVHDRLVVHLELTVVNGAAQPPRRAEVLCGGRPRHARPADGERQHLADR